MPTIKFTVPGNPVALKRHRSFQRGNMRGTYDPSKGDKGDFLAKCMEHRPDMPIDGPIVVSLKCFFQRPKSHYRTGKRAGELKENAPDAHTKVPDSDNILKFVGDALNKIFWRDDSLICQVHMGKFYDGIPRIEIEIRY